MNKNIIDVVKAYLSNQSFEINNFNNDIVDLAKKQALLPMLYLVTKSSNLKKYYISSSITLEKFKMIQNEVTELFNANEIQHVYFKGTVLSDIYPDPVIRTRGDIDVYIANNKIPNVTKILEENGYTKIDGDCMHHVSFRKFNLEIEIHFNMFDEECRFLKYFRNPFELCINESNYLYRFNETAHFIYCLCHFYNHLVSGCGIRFILDFYYMFNNYSLNFDEIHDFINEYNLKVLYNNILNTIFYFTNIKYDNIDIINIDFFIEYLVKSGIHGFDNEDRNKNRAINKEHKFKYAISRVFMFNKQYRISIYPILDKWSILYPFCLIHHLFYLIFFKSKKAFKLFFSGKGTNKEEKDYFKKIGL